MTLLEIEERLQDLIVGDGGSVVNYLLEEAMRLAKSGAVDISNYDDNFGLPKTLLHVALKNLSRDYTPFDEGEKKVADNLKHF